MTTLGRIAEFNVTVDGGDGGWVRVVLVAEDGDVVSGLMPKDVAEAAALEMSPRLTLQGESDD